MTHISLCMMEIGENATGWHEKAQLKGQKEQQQVKHEKPSWLTLCVKERLFVTAWCSAEETLSFAHIPWYPTKGAVFTLG